MEIIMHLSRVLLLAVSLLCAPIAAHSAYVSLTPHADLNDITAGDVVMFTVSIDPISRPFPTDDFFSSSWKLLSIGQLSSTAPFTTQCENRSGLRAKLECSEYRVTWDLDNDGLYKTTISGDLFTFSLHFDTAGEQLLSFSNINYAVFNTERRNAPPTTETLFILPQYSLDTPLKILVKDDTASVPEPSSLSILALSFASLVLTRRVSGRRRSAVQSLAGYRQQ
jgi:hypothetical protein